MLFLSAIYVYVTTIKMYFKTKLYLHCKLYISTENNVDLSTLDKSELLRST